MMTEFVMLAAGLVAGAVAVWLILKGKIQVAADKAKDDAEAERAGLNVIESVEVVVEKTTRAIKAAELIALPPPTRQPLEPHSWKPA